MTTEERAATSDVSLSNYVRALRLLSMWRGSFLRSPWKTERRSDWVSASRLNGQCLRLIREAIEARAKEKAT